MSANAASPCISFFPWNNGTGANVSTSAKIKHSRLPPGSSSPAIDLFLQFLPQYLIHLRRIRLAPGSLHHLADQGVEGLFLASLEFLYGFRVDCQHFMYQFLQCA